MLMNPMLNIAVQAIRQAGNFIIKQYDVLNTKNHIKTKEYKNSLLMKINLHINQLIESIVKKYYPTHNIVAKNIYNYNKSNHQIEWIINPLDNQTNFTNHVPYFASSIAIKIKGYTEISVIYDPIHNDLFSAIRGEGSRLNGYRIHNTTKNTLHKETIITCFPYFKQNSIMSILNKTHTQKKLIKFRYNGAITLDLAYIAAGRIDALFAINIKTQKLDSGLLLVKEAGGLILNLNKNKKNYQTNHHHIYKNIIVGNPKFIKAIIKKNPIFKKILLI